MSNTTEGNINMFDVYPTPNATEGGQTTYQARRVPRQTLNETYLRNHIAKETLIQPDTFELVMRRLILEIPEHLRQGFDLHIKGFGTFYMKIGMKSKRYTDPDAITADELKVEGIGFRADKEFNDLIRQEIIEFERIDAHQSEPVDESQMVPRLVNYCHREGFFTVSKLRGLFRLTRYKAAHIANELVSGDDALFVREKEGTGYIYKLKTP